MVPGTCGIDVLMLEPSGENYFFCILNFHRECSKFSLVFAILQGDGGREYLEIVVFAKNNEDKMIFVDERRDESADRHRFI